MFFRSQKKLQGEVSLSETLETDKDGNSLFLMDVVGVEDTMLDDLDIRESHIRVRQLVDQCLTEREADIIRQRYGLGGKVPRTQRELAAEYGISRSYVSRRAYCKRCPGKPLKAGRNQKHPPQQRDALVVSCFYSAPPETTLISAKLPF